MPTSIRVTNLFVQI